MSSEVICARSLSLEPNDYGIDRTYLLEYLPGLQFRIASYGLASLCSKGLVHLNNQILSIQTHLYSNPNRRDTQSYLRANRSSYNAPHRMTMIDDRRK